MNVWNFTGRLGQDAEVKYTPSQTAICSFSVAVESGYGDKKKTTWARCALFGKRAEGGLPQYLKKGAQVAISGEATLREWESNGKSGTSLEVRVNELDLIGGKQDSQPAPQQQERMGGQKDFTPAGPDYDGDIPF